MKRIFTHLFVSVLLMLSATSWAQSETNYTVTPSQGSYNKTGWCSSWTSGSDVTYPLTTISISGGINNMNASTDNAAGGFEFAVGQNSPSTWTFSVMGGYVIESYSFDFVSKTSGSNLTISAAGIESMTSSSSSQTWSVSGVNAQTASFQLSGGNNKIIVTNLKFTVRERQLEEGHVYRFVNRNTGRALNAYSESVVNAVAPDATSLQQQWYVTKEGDHFVLRNLYYAKYLKGAHVNKVVWSLTDDYSSDANKFTYVKSDAEYNSLETKGWTTYGFMHDDGNSYNGGTRVVSWNNENTSKSSHWTTCEVEYTADELQAILDERPTAAEAVAKVSENFISLFKETACYTPKYSSLAEAQATAAYRALTDEMQQLVDKIYDKTYGSGWGEANADATKEAWGAEYAKKFRVQMYEPYSIAGDITSWVGINSHANNDNPTGIYVHEAGTIYVMVEGEIAEGATLRLIDAGSNDRITNAATGGYALTTGLNVINFTGAGGMLYICYNVDTYNPNGTDDATRFPHKLSEYAPLKIHVEGGAINGFYNACGDFLAGKNYDGVTYNSDLWKEITGASVDKDADWEYMESRANLSVLPILGHRQILLFQLNDTEDNEGKLCNGMKTLLPDRVSVPNEPYSSKDSWSKYGMGCDPENGKINILLEAWDRVMYSELATMGLLSKDDMARMNDFYPRWNADGAVSAEIYDYSNASKIDGKTLEQFCGVDYSEVFNHHGVALGTTSGYMYGGGDHCGYNINTFNGVIETFASNAGSTWGPGHEIGHQHQALFTLNGLTEVTNNLFSNIALWYKGMSTSRYNGNEGSLEKVLEAFNTGDVYTNNIWALTHMYYRLWLYYHLAGNNTQFYPRLFELLRHDPMVKAYQQAGDVSMMHFYKLVCQAAGEDLTEFFRAHGYFTVMEDRFVGDYSNSVYNLSQQMIDEAIAEVKAMDYPENLSIIFINDDDENAKYVQHDGQTKRVIYGETTPNSDFGSVTDFIAGNVATIPYTTTLNSDGTITMSGGEGGVGFLIVNEKGEIVSFSNKSTFALGDEAMETIVSGKATIKSVDSNNNVVEADVDITALQRGVLGALIAKAQPIVDKIDETYTRIGYFKGAAVADLKDVLAYAKEVYAGSSGYEAAYDILYAEYQKVLDMPDAKITVDLNRKYIITNNAYPTRNIAVDGTTVYALDDRTSAAQWSLVETGTADSYYLKNTDGYYCPAVVTGGTGGDATKEITSAGVYTLKELEHGLWAIIGKNAPLHASKSQSYNIVGWSYEAAASQWYITATETDEKLANLSELQALIAKTELLLDEVAGTVTYAKGEPLPLQTTAEGSAGYLWSNAPETREGNIANLVDGAANNYFHTDWSSEPPSGSHYLAVYLGEDNTLSSFTFSHTTRSGAETDFPKSVDVYGSDDNVTYKYIASASGMPQSAGTAWEFDGVMLSSYKYLRFNYHANRGYWHMAEFDITPVTGFTATVNDTYSSTVEVDEVTAAMNALHNGKRTANGISPTTSDVEEKLQALQSAYNTLYKKYKATIDARKATLAALVTETETLINQVGNITFAQENKLTLTTENLYCNAPYIAQNNNDYSAAYVDKLTDGSKTTFLHTDYSGTVAAPHYLRVDLESGSTTTKFRFNYSTRDNGNNCPTTIVIEGCDSADGTYTTITTLTTADGLPNPGQNTNGGVAADFESSVIEMSKAYRYIRFTVTKTEGNANTFFVMSEFGFAIVANEVTVYDAYKSYLAEELLLTTMFVTISSKAMSTNDLVTSVPLLDEQIADQQAAYDTLRAVEHAASSHTLVVGAAGYATLYLGNNTIIPAGVEAYIVSAVGGSSVTLTRVKDVLPACQGVIVKAAAGEYDFIRTADAATCDFADNLLKGTLVDTKVETPAYVLGLVEGEVGFYKAVTAGYADGTFLNNANKAYLPMSNTDGAASYSFRFGEGTTGVGEVEGESGNVKGEIYDLTGRRVEAVTAPGIYIVGGKKILVK